MASCTPSAWIRARLRGMAAFSDISTVSVNSTTNRRGDSPLRCSAWLTTVSMSSCSRSRPDRLTATVAVGCGQAAPTRHASVTTQELSLIHISEPTRLLSISYAVFCLKKKKTTTQTNNKHYGAATNKKKNNKTNTHNQDK